MREEGGIDMELLSKEEVMGGICPVCRVTGPGVGFGVLRLGGEDVWVCRKCGLLFIPKHLRGAGGKEGVEKGISVEEARRRIEEAKGKGVLHKAVVEEAAVVELEGEKRGFVCPECGKVLKNEFGLRGHMRSHGVVDGGGEGTG